MGAWASYGLGSMNENLPAFIVLVSQDATKDQPLYSRLWGAGFLPSEHQGVQFKAGKGGEQGIDVMLLSQDKFSKLDEETKAKLRGDEL